jgi:CDP-diacylglycerol---serine O-phosphatidyltransferase
MSKLSSGEKFIDVSDYGRPFAVAIANRLKRTNTTPVHVTLMFGISGLIAIYCIIKGYYLAAGLFLILKSILDAADGELARLKKTPSYTGRYLDSVFDIILNLFLLLSIRFVTGQALWITLLAFASMQLQGTLYNYYYVILRHHTANGDKTSKIFETEIPKAYSREKQKTVNTLFRIYTLLYSVYDRIIYKLDRKAPEEAPFPKWFMTMISIYGLGFQLLIISFMLAIGFIDYIIPFFICFSLFVIVFVFIRRVFLSKR